jgi:cytidylate kinase
VAPLLPAAEARRIDTTDLTIDDVVQLMLSEINPQLLQGDR